MPKAQKSWLRKLFGENEEKGDEIGSTSVSNEKAYPVDRAASEEQIPSEWNVGDVIMNIYKVTGILGEGGMGKVLKVHHRDWDVDLAVKTPRSEVLSEFGGQAVFVREAETWVNLGLHPNIVGCYYVRTLGGIPRVFSEYIAGGSLKDWIQQGRLYKGKKERVLVRILDIAIQVAWGLQYAHESGLVHQDIKPHNVMMTLDGIPKITDFGLAKAGRIEGRNLSEGEQNNSVSVGGMTRAYSSPEQISLQTVTNGTDIWSWAVTLLEMLTGEVTWVTGDTAGEVLNSLNEHSLMSSQIAAIPPAVVNLLQKCFQTDPEFRPDNMLEIAGYLQEIYQQITKQPYPRQIPDILELRAESLNNKALSLLDLGREEEAERAWSEALHYNPLHLGANYNQGVRLWRRGEITDEILVQRLERVTKARNDWTSHYLLGLVHLERGDLDAALAKLENAAKLAPQEKEVLTALQKAGSAQTINRRMLYMAKEYSDPVDAVFLSSDGRFALSGHWTDAFRPDYTLRLWETHTGRMLSTFNRHSEGVKSVCMSKDGYVFAGRSDNTVQLWDVSTILEDKNAHAHHLRAFTGHTENENLFGSTSVRSVSLGSNGTRMLSGSDDKTLKLWNVDTGRCLRTFSGHKDSIFSVDLSKDGRWALSGSADGTLKLWDVTSGNCVRTFEGHRGIVFSVRLNPDGSQAISAGQDHTIKIWDLVSGDCLRTLEGHLNEVNSVCLSYDGKFALSSSDDKTLRLWEVATGCCIRTFTGHTKEIYCVALSEDGRLAISGSSDLTVRIWELRAEIVRFCIPFLERPRSYLELSEVDEQVNTLLEQGDGELKQGNIRSATDLVRQARSNVGYEHAPQAMKIWGELYLSCAHRGIQGVWHSKTLNGDARSISLSADGQYVLTSNLQLWHIATGQCLYTLEKPNDNIGSVSLNSDGTCALVGMGGQTLSSNDNSLYLWEITTGRLLKTLTGHSNGVLSVNLSPDNQFALSGSKDNTVRLWELETGNCLWAKKSAAGDVVAACFSPDGRWALTGGSVDRTGMITGIRGMYMQYLDISGPRTEFYLGEDDVRFGVDSISISSDGRLVALGFHTTDNGLALYENFGKPLYPRKLDGHNQPVTSTCFTPDGKWLVSGSEDQTVRIWEVATGRCIHVLSIDTAVDAVAITADGHWLLVGTHKSLEIWEIDLDLEFRDPVEWDDAALPFLENFVTNHTPSAYQEITNQISSKDEIHKKLIRFGNPTWNESDFQQLIFRLRCAGLGWLKAEGVRNKLNELFGLPPHQLYSQARVDELLQQAESTLVKDPTRALSIAKKAREISGYDNLPLAMDVWSKLYAYNKQTSLRSIWAQNIMIQQSGVMAVHLSWDGRIAISGNKDNELQVWDVASRRCLLTCEGHTDQVHSVFLSRDSRLAISGSYDETVRLWDTTKNHCLEVLEGHSGVVNSVCISDDMCWALSGGADKTLRLWDLSTGACRRIFQGHSKALTSVCFSADGRLALSSAADATIRLWNVSSGKCLQILQGHEDFVWSAVLSQDARLVLTGSADTTLRVWDLTSGRCLRTLEGHEAPIYSVQLSANGQWAVSGSQDRTIRIWDVNSGRCIRVLRNHTGAAYSVYFSPDARWLLSGSNDQTMRLWELDWTLEP